MQDMSPGVQSKTKMWSSLAFWRKKSSKHQHAVHPIVTGSVASPPHHAPRPVLIAHAGVRSSDEPVESVRRKSSYSSSFIALAKQVGSLSMHAIAIMHLVPVEWYNREAAVQLSFWSQ